MKKQNIHQWMRALHRDLGFLAIGLTLVYALSGILLIYRNTDVLKVNKTEELTLNAGLKGKELGAQLRLRRFEVEREEDHKIYYKEGVYDTQTGIATVTRKVYPFPVNKLVSLHKVSGTSKVSPFALLYGVLLTFLAVSSLFMFKWKSKMGKRGLVFTTVGIVLTVLSILLL